LYFLNKSKALRGITLNIITMKLEFISKLENKDFDLQVYGSNDDGFDASDITANWHIVLDRSESMIKSYDAFVDSIDGYVLNLDNDSSIDISAYEIRLEDSGSGTTYIDSLEIEIDKKIITVYFD